MRKIFLIVLLVGVACLAKGAAAEAEGEAAPADRRSTSQLFSLLEKGSFCSTISQETANELYQMTNDWFTACEKHGIPSWAEGGTYLGARRAGGQLPHDDDDDVGMWKSDLAKFKRTAKKDLEEAGYSLMWYVFGYKLYKDSGEDIPGKPFKYPFIDVFMLGDEGGQTYYTNTNWYKNCKWTTSTLSNPYAHKIPYGPIMIPASSDGDDYLDSCYGPEWKTHAVCGKNHATYAVDNGGQSDLGNKHKITKADKKPMDATVDIVDNIGAKSSPAPKKAKKAKKEDEEEDVAQTESLKQDNDSSSSAASVKNLLSRMSGSAKSQHKKQHKKTTDSKQSDDAAAEKDEEKRDADSLSDESQAALPDNVLETAAGEDQSASFKSNADANDKMAQTGNSKAKDDAADDEDDGSTDGEGVNDDTKQEDKVKSKVKKDPTDDDVDPLTKGQPDYSKPENDEAEDQIEGVSNSERHKSTSIDA